MEEPKPILLSHGCELGATLAAAFSTKELPVRSIPWEVLRPFAPSLRAHRMAYELLVFSLRARPFGGGVDGHRWPHSGHEPFLSWLGLSIGQPIGQPMDWPV